jgi:hypothetical protein
MDSIIFRNARIRYVDLRRDDEAGIFTRVHLSSDLSGPIEQQMGWGEIPEGCTSAKLAGVLQCRHFVLTPTDKALQQHEIQMECSQVGDFNVAGIKDDEGELTGYDLRFILRTIENGATGILENYLRTVGGAPAALKVSYEVQETLPETETEKQLPLAAAEPSEDDEFAGEPEDKIEEPPSEEYDPPGAIAPAVVAHGNTDKLKKARRERLSKLPKGASDPDEDEQPAPKGQPLRKFEFNRGNATAKVTVHEDSAARFLADCGDGKALVGRTQPCQSIHAAAVSACAEIESWARAAAEIGSGKVKAAAAQILSWARDTAGQMRVEGRTA